MESDIDEDFFTPSPGTSLANIFSNKISDKTQNSENTTLKYVAPKPSDFKNIQEENDSQIGNSQIVDNTSKSSECVFAHAVFAYELVNNNYAPRGKLGLALLKLFTPLEMKLVLYDSNKRALSSASVSTNFEIRTQNGKYISYYDDVKKNWSLSCSNIEELNIIIQTLRKWNINIIYHDEHVNRGPTTSPKPVVKKTLVMPEMLKDSSDKGSDTDSINRKTKTSILNRMALVGQSVLPSPPIVDKTSDSSDTDLHPHYKISRHKPHKTNSKRQHAEKKLIDEITTSEPAYTIAADYKTSVMKTPIQVAEDMQISTDLKQLVSITSFNNDNLSHSSDMKNFITEHRVNNTELRININRVADKVDLILDKIKNTECESAYCNNSDFTKNLLQKLLTEYESKIKDQNEKIKELETLLYYRGSVTTKCDILVNQKVKETDHENEILNLKLKIQSLEKENIDKTKEILNLKSEIDSINKKLINKNEIIHDLENKCESVINDLTQKNEEFELLKLDHNKVDKELHKLNLKCKEVLHRPSDEQMHAQLKSIMNDTFRSLAANFDNNENYRGDFVKTIIGTIIKKTTMEVLST